MSGLASLFSKPETPKAPAPPSPPPKISDADVSARKDRQELRKRRGLSSTVLTHGLGGGSGSNRRSTGTGGGSAAGASTLLGGGTRTA